MKWLQFKDMRATTNFPTALDHHVIFKVYTSDRIKIALSAPGAQHVFAGADVTALRSKLCPLNCKQYFPFFTTLFLFGNRA